MNEREAISYLKILLYIAASDQNISECKIFMSR